MSYTLEKPFKIIKLKLGSIGEVTHEHADMNIIARYDEWKVNVEGDFEKPIVDRLRRIIRNGESESFHAELITGENISGRLILTSMVNLDNDRMCMANLEYTGLGEVLEE